MADRGVGTLAQVDASARLDEIRGRTRRAALRAGRDSDEVTLIAVSKTFPAEAILELYRAGQRDFGESRLQEWEQKRAALPTDIRWHFVGHLQSNKARRIADGASVIHSLGSESALVELEKRETKCDVLIEVNVASEPQKSGIFPEALDRFIDKVLECNEVCLKGLMTIGPSTRTAEESRPWFRLMNVLREGHPQLQWLSMGMSQDFEVAIEEGSTHIRVGSALFGRRP